MNIVLLSTPPTVVPENPWPGVEISWTSPDGSTTWVLTDDASPVRLLSGTRGLGKPKALRFKDEAPGLWGSRYRGHRYEEREVFWPLLIFGGSSTQEHLDIDAAFWASIQVGETGTWRVSTPDNGYRTMRLRFDREDTGWDLAPGLADWSLYELYLVAEDPLWTSEMVVREFGTSAGSRFADPATPALWHISSASTMQEATINNPGGVRQFPIWWWHGPFDSATGGVDGRVVDVDFEVIEGRTLVVDTSPQDRRAIEVITPDLTGLSDLEQLEAMRVAMLTGTDRTLELGSSTAFAAVPPGGVVPLDVGMVGTGSTRVMLIPQHERAWG